MRYYLISHDEDTRVGLRLAGIEGTVVSGRTEFTAELERVISDEDVAVLLVTEECASYDATRIQELKLSLHRPLVAVIPGSREKIAGHSIMQLIREAIGIKI